MKYCNYIIAAICTLFISQITFAQAGTNGDDRSEDGRLVKEYNLTIERKRLIASIRIIQSQNYLFKSTF